jgi:hypothetical protein
VPRLQSKKVVFSPSIYRGHFYENYRFNKGIRACLW